MMIDSTLEYLAPSIFCLYTLHILLLYSFSLTIVSKSVFLHLKCMIAAFHPNHKSRIMETLSNKTVHGSKREYGKPFKYWIFVLKKGLYILDKHVVVKMDHPRIAKWFSNEFLDWSICIRTLTFIFYDSFTINVRRKSSKCKTDYGCVKTLTSSLNLNVMKVFILN